MPFAFDMEGEKVISQLMSTQLRILITGVAGFVGCDLRPQTSCGRNL